MSDWKTQLKTVAGKAEDGSGFFDAKGGLRVELVDREHMDKMASGMAEDGLLMNQLNRFFRHCRRIQSRLSRNETSWEKEKSAVALLSAHAADAYGKSPRKIPQSFKEFIDRNVARIHTEDDFVKGFMKHFEALMGFASLYAKKSQKG
jgi:CRISPR type III-A-associated protein Csm2